LSLAFLRNSILSGAEKTVSKIKLCFFKIHSSLLSAARIAAFKTNSLLFQSPNSS
jgi:hypothetical protein